MSFTTASLPLCSASVSAERSAPRFIFLFTRISCECGCGPCATPPPTHCGERIEPWRARPVPFWRHGFFPPPETSPRVLVECVPARIPASPASTTWCISGTLTLDSNTSAGRSRGPTFLPCASRSVDRGHQAPFPAPAGALTAERTMTSAAVRARDGALDEEQVALGVGLHDLEVQDGDALVAVLAGHPHALEHARAAWRTRRSSPANGASSPCRGSSRDPANPWRRMTPENPLPRETPTTSARSPGREDVGPELLAGRVARRRRPCGARRGGGPDVPAVRVEVALHRLVRGGLGERELDGVVAVGLLRLHLRDEARPGLDDRDRDRARLFEDLGHAQLLAEDAFDLGHSLISMSTPAERFRRWSSWTVLDVASTMSMSPFVREHLEVLARVLVLVRRPDDRVDRRARSATAPARRPSRRCA